MSLTRILFMNAKALVQSLRVHVTRAAAAPNRLTPVSRKYLVKSIFTATVIAVTITVIGMGQGLAQARPQTIRMKALSANDQAPLHTDSQGSHPEPSVPHSRRSW